MTIARHRVLNPAVLTGIGFVLFASFGLLVVDPANLASPVLESIWVPSMWIGLVIFSVGLVGVVRARGRMLVGGPGWLAPYHASSLRPTKERVEVNDRHGLKIVVEPIRQQFADKHHENWVELVVVDQTGTEVVRCFANPDWLVDDYDEALVHWERNQSSD